MLDFSYQSLSLSTPLDMKPSCFLNLVVGAQTFNHVARLRLLNRLRPESIIKLLHLCAGMQAAALLKHQIYRLQFLHRNVKLDVLNGAHQLLPSIVFRP